MAPDVGMAEGAGLILDAVIAASMVIHTSRRSAFDLHALLRRPAGRVFPIRSVTALTTFLPSLATFCTGPKSSTVRSKTLTAIC